jgi:hypothetical protein
MVVQIFALCQTLNSSFSSMIASAAEMLFLFSKVSSVTEINNPYGINAYLALQHLDLHFWVWINLKSTKAFQIQNCFVW